MEWTKTHAALFEKIDREYDEYEGRMQQMPGHAVYAHAEEIAAMKFCYNQIMSHLSDYPAEALEMYLLLDNPLEMMASFKMSLEDSGDHSEEFDRIFRGAEGQEQSGPGMNALGMC